VAIWRGFEEEGRSGKRTAALVKEGQTPYKCVCTRRRKGTTPKIRLGEKNRRKKPNENIGLDLNVRKTARDEGAKDGEGLAKILDSTERMNLGKAFCRLEDGKKHGGRHR